MMFTNLLFVFYLFPIKFNYLPLSTSRLVILIAVVHFLCNSTKYIFLKNYFIKFITPILLLSFVSLLSNIGNDRFDLTVFFNVIEIFVLYPVTAVFLISRMKDNGVIEVLVKIRFAIYIQIIFIYLMFFNDYFKNFYLSLINSAVPEDHYPLRHVGLTGFAAYNMGLFLNLIVFIEFILISNKIKINIINSILKVLCILIPSLMLSRTGLLLPILYFVYFLLVFRIDKSNYEGFKFVIIFNSIVVLAPIILISTALILVESFPFMEWVLDPILSISKGEIPEGASVLNDQYWNPSLKTLIFGDGFFSNNSGGYYMDTDGGYMRLLLFFGIPASLLFYLTIIFIFLYLAKFVNKIKHVKQFIIITLAVILIVQYKGNIIFDGSELIKIVFIIGLSGFINNSLNKYLPPK
jgi:hypothetical protein